MNILKYDYDYDCDYYTAEEAGTQMYNGKIRDIHFSIIRNTYRDSFLSEGMSKAERSIFTCSAEIAITEWDFSTIPISEIGLKLKDRKTFFWSFVKTKLFSDFFKVHMKWNFFLRYFT